MYFRTISYSIIIFVLFIRYILENSRGKRYLPIFLLIIYFISFLMFEVFFFYLFFFPVGELRDLPDYVHCSQNSLQRSGGSERAEVCWDAPPPPLPHGKL